LITALGLRVRAALTAMADKWEIEPDQPSRASHRMRVFSFRDFDSMAMQLTGEPIVRGNVVQAECRGIKVFK